MSLVKSYYATYKDALSHTVFVTLLFNSGAKSRTRFARFVEKIVFLLVFLGLLFISVFAVFSAWGVDTWIKFSLYIVPLFSMICGHLIFKSHSFKEILSRRIEQNDTSANDADYETSEHDRRYSNTFDNLSSFLRKRSLRTCFYPISLLLYQWTLFLIFFYDKGISEYVGSLNISDDPSHLTRGLHFVIEQNVWWPFYYIFWTTAMYITGFVACCFILVVDIQKIDIKSFMRKIGNGPLIQNCRYLYNARVTTPVGFCFSALSLITGFFTFGLVELASRPHWEARQLSPISGYEDIQNLEGDVFDSECSSELTSSAGIETGKGSSSSGKRGGPPKSITPREASKLLVHLKSSLERNGALFKPFLVLLTFFPVTNLVTLFAAMAFLKETGFTDLHWWTLVRTLILFLLAIRLLWSAASITNTLSRIIPHIYYLRSVGELTGTKEEWDDFFKLAETFQLGTKTHGFPLTLKEVASLIGVLNFTFLIVLSLISKTKGQASLESDGAA